MGRKAKRPHELVPYRKRYSAVVRWRGKEVYLGPWDRARDEPSIAATARLADLVALWKADPVAEPVRPRGETLAALWLDWRQSPEGAARFRGSAGRAARFLFGTAAEPGPNRHTVATDFRGEQLRAFQRQLCEAKLARDTVVKAVRCVRECFAWGLVGRRVEYDQFRELELVPPPARGQVKEATKRRGVLWATVEPVLPHLTAPLAACVRLMWLTCARPSELLRTTCGEVKTGGTLHAVSGIVLDLDELDVWAVSRTCHKTDGTEYDRVIFFGPKARDILRPLLAGQPPEAAVFRPADGRAQWAAKMAARRKPGGPGSHKKLKGAAGRRKPGETYFRNTLQNAVAEACEAHGLTYWTPYQLRHQVFKLVQQKFGRDAARVFGGHQVGGATEDYAGTDLTTAAKVALAWG